MKYFIQALKLWLAEHRVKHKARRIALEMYGKGKSTRGQRDRYVRGQVALWERKL